MADSVKQSDKTEPVVAPVKAVKTWRNVPVWGWAIGALIVFFAVVGMVAACFSVFNHANNRLVTTSRVGMMQRGLTDDQDQFSTGRSGFGGRMMGGMGTSTNSSTRVSGVVTAVDGNTITVAGNGTTTKLTVSDSTTYGGSTKPAAVNDTIMATGATASDGSFTAATVYLSRH